MLKSGNFSWWFDLELLDDCFKWNPFGFRIWFEVEMYRQMFLWKSRLWFRSELLENSFFLFDKKLCFFFLASSFSNSFHASTNGWLTRFCKTSWFVHSFVYLVPEFMLNLNLDMWNLRFLRLIKLLQFKRKIDVEFECLYVAPIFWSSRQ